MKYASLQPELATLLRRLPSGTTADMPDGGRLLDADFDFDDRSFNQVHSDIAAWMAAPHYSMRPELLDWLKGDQS